MTLEQYNQLDKALRDIHDAYEKLNFDESTKSSRGIILEEAQEYLDYFREGIEKEGKTPGDAHFKETMALNDATMFLSFMNLLFGRSEEKDKKQFYEFASLMQEKLTPLEEIFKDTLTFKNNLETLNIRIQQMKPVTAAKKEGAKGVIQDDLIPADEIFRLKDKKVLSGDGSPEYKKLHEALNKDHSDYDRFERSWEYLRRKETVPWSTDGKKRVEAAARVMARSAVNFIKKVSERTTMDDSFYDIIRVEACRNETFRSIMMEELPKLANEDIRENYNCARLHATLCYLDIQCKVNGKSELVSGKMDGESVEEDKRYQTALDTMLTYEQNVNKAINKGYLDTPNLIVRSVNAEYTRFLKQNNLWKPAPPKPTIARQNPDLQAPKINPV